MSKGAEGETREMWSYMSRVVEPMLRNVKVRLDQLHTEAECTS